MGEIISQTVCPTCRHLKFTDSSDAQNLKVKHSIFWMLEDQSQDDFHQSAKNGCQYCNLVCQAAVLLRSAAERPVLSINIYKDHPTELHSRSSSEEYDVVEIYASPGSKNDSFPSLGNDVPSRPDSESSFKFIESRYSRCLQEHEECRQQSTQLPKRVLDISGPDYRLVEPDPGTQGTYAALSYCWGARGQKITTLETIDQCKSCIPRNTFPVVFEEAATVTRRLGINYLWIDTVCIIQDNRQDWENEAAKMADIFENATVTIAASSSPDPTVSFLTGRSSSYRDIELKHDLQDENRSVVFKARRKMSLGMHTKGHQTGDIDPLDSRAWALQEKELATRLISFTGGEIQWKCKQQLLCECQNNSFPLNPFYRTHSALPEKDRNDQRYKDWHRIVEEHTSRKVTFITDRVPALGGMAGKFSAITGATYMAGQWKENLLQDLSWQRHHEAPLIPVPQYLGPSYSWVSIANPTNYALARDSYPGTRIQRCSITNPHCETSGSGTAGHVTGGSMTVRGPTVTARLCSSNPEDGQSYTLQIGDAVFTTGTFERGVCEFSIDTLLENSPSEQNTQTTREDMRDSTLQQAFGACEARTVDGVVKLLSLYTISHPTYVYENFLVLGNSRTQEDAYERIGIGTGKIYRTTDGRNDSVPEQPGPFEWLAAAFDRMRPEVDGASIEEMLML